MQTQDGRKEKNEAILGTGVTRYFHSLRLKLNTQNTLTESSFDLTKSSQVLPGLVKKLSQVKALLALLD